MSGYRYLDHTADLGLEVTSPSLTELFCDTGRALFETQVSGPVAADQDLVFELTAVSIEELFLDWCRELLYNFSVRGFIPRTYDLTLNDLNLKARIKGGIFDPEKNRITMEIKNPTYHKLQIEKLPDAYRLTIILDV
jgi:SHS2 domain-containing protein